jgi:hypothetical protein
MIHGRFVVIGFVALGRGVRWFVRFQSICTFENDNCMKTLQRTMDCPRLDAVFALFRPPDSRDVTRNVRFSVFVRFFAANPYAFITDVHCAHVRRSVSQNSLAMRIRTRFLRIANTVLFRSRPDNAPSRSRCHRACPGHVGGLGRNRAFCAVLALCQVLFFLLFRTRFPFHFTRRVIVLYLFRTANKKTQHTHAR